VLPNEIVEQWRAKAPLRLDLLAHWATLPPLEALDEFHLYCGKTTKFPSELRLQPRRRQKNLPLMTATNYGLKRMGRLRSAVVTAPALDENTKVLCLQIVDFCMGGREVVIGIHDPTTRKRGSKSRCQDDPRMPQLPDLGTGEPIPFQTKQK
jgi:hypothetical protein